MNKNNSSVPSSEKLLSIENLDIHFGKKVTLDQVSLDISAGEIIGLVGESGAGKSMLAHSILKILPQNAAIPKGKILYNNQNLIDKTEEEMQMIRGNEISMIFQDPLAALNPTIPVGLQIAEGLRWHKKISRKESVEEVMRIMKRVGVADPQHRYGQYPFEFSGGMRQRVMIAMALICKPKLLIADEPTTSLDVTIQAQILDLLKELRDEFSMAILLITHDLGVVASVCDKVVVMQKGRVMETGYVDDIFYKPENGYTKTLLAAKKRVWND